MLSPVHLKVDLAVRGLRLAPELARDGLLTGPVGARDFASRDVELLLSDDVIACCPVGTAAAARSPYELRAENDRFFVARLDAHDAIDERYDTSVIPPPSFYSRRTQQGRQMWEVGTVHAGYISIDPATYCGFAAQGVACQFCTLAGQETNRSVEMRPVEEVLEVIRAAFEEGAAEFVYFNTGFFEAEDGGFSLLEPYIDAVKREFDTLLAVQAHPPSDDKWIDRTYAAGVDALSYSIEIHDPQILREICRGRATLIGRERYYQALEHAAKIFPSGTVWSDLIVGLEPFASTREAIDRLTDMGVLPVLSLFRPLDETSLATHPLPVPADIAPLYAHLYTAVREARINVQYMRDLGYAITPIEARFFAGEDARLDVAVSSFYRSKLGGRAVRGLSKLRRQLRVRRVSESFDSSRL